MTKNDLIAYIAEHAKLTKVQAKEALDATLEGVVKGMKKDGEVRLVGFGNFVVTKRAATTARNPKTGETVKVPASKRAGFRAGQALKTSINK